MPDEETDRSTEDVLQHDLIDAIRRVTQMRALYLEILEDLVRGYASALRRRNVSRAKIQQRLSTLITEATGDSSSPLLLYAARWVSEMLPTSSEVPRGIDRTADGDRS